MILKYWRWSHGKGQIRLLSSLPTANSFGLKFVDRSRKMLEHDWACPPESVVVFCTQNHAGPGVPASLERFKAACIQAAELAADKLEPCQMTHVTMAGDLAIDSY